MAKTVYIFGAGINKAIQDWDGLSPPLVWDFFQVALKHRTTGSQEYRRRIKEVFDFIERHWGLSVHDLETQPFDLEACFTFIFERLDEAQKAAHQDALQDLLKVYFRLTATLAELLGEFFHYPSEEFRALGEIILADKAAVLTFNYDTLIESTVESASGVRAKLPASFLRPPTDRDEITDEELAYSHFNLNRPLVYGVRFDEVRLQRAGVPAHVPGPRFYGYRENQFYDPPILKLHGSLNWFKQTGVPKFPGLPPSMLGAKPQPNQTVLTEAHWWLNEFPDMRGWLLEPLIVTPGFHKDYSSPILTDLWRQAREQLKDCHRLIVGGYSLPDNDAEPRRLLREAFVARTPEELIVINPDPGVVEKIKSLCSYQAQAIVYKDLAEFVSSYTPRE